MENKAKIIAAMDGDLNAMYSLAHAYFMGDGVKQDYLTAINWANRAAAQGHPKAQYLLGYAYNEGMGLGQDKIVAIQWFRRSAEQGYADAQCVMGDVYANGRCVAVNIGEAVSWYEKAANQGCVKSIENLKRFNVHEIKPDVPIKAVSSDTLCHACNQDNPRTRYTCYYCGAVIQIDNRQKTDHSPVIEQEAKEHVYTIREKVQGFLNDLKSCLLLILVGAFIISIFVLFSYLMPDSCSIQNDDREVDDDNNSIQRR